MKKACLATQTEYGGGVPSELSLIRLRLLEHTEHKKRANERATSRSEDVLLFVIVDRY